MGASIFSRKKDLVYLVFFLIHIPIMLSVDLTPLYPTAIKPEWMEQIRVWYVATYGDRFFYNAPPWFHVYIAIEALFLLPFSLWAIPALLRNDPRLPLAMLVFALEITFTTLTCLAEVLSWPELTPQQRGVQGLGGMYGGYLALGVFMAVDCYGRVDQILARDKHIRPIAKKEL